VLCRAGTAVDLTRDHKPALEKERIERDGGKVEYSMLNGDLQVSRAFGNVHTDTGHKAKGLSSVPEITKCHLTDDDEFVILACDGLWDVMPSQAAVSFVRHSLQLYNDCEKASEDLVHEALRQHSEDNITAIVVGFSRVSPQYADLGRYIVQPAPSSSRPRSRSIIATNTLSPANSQCSDSKTKPVANNNSSSSYNSTNNTGSNAMSYASNSSTTSSCLSVNHGTSSSSVSFTHTQSQTSSGVNVTMQLSVSLSSNCDPSRKGLYIPPRRRMLNAAAVSQVQKALDECSD
jgi:hypothetical protein